MPELPEVETTRRGVAPHVIGRRVVRVDVYDRRLRWPVPGELAKRLEGALIDRVDRRSKYLLFHAGDSALLVHLGMTGTLRIWREPPPRALHDHVDITLDDGAVLRYRDPRRFGAMLWIASTANGHPLLDALGPEPFDPAFDADYLWRVTRKRRAAIKLALMDNHIVTGVGNIYANEALFRAGIRPSAAAGKLSKARPRETRRRRSLRARRGDCQGRQHAARLRRIGWRRRLLPARLLRLRPRRCAVPRLRSPDPADADRPALDVPLSALPAAVSRIRVRRR
jgi:formamidopyrimidine-DNA glycosylase